MSIRAIPNQPIGFSPSRIVNCQSIDPAECLLMDENNDTLTFQAVWEPCIVGGNQVADPSFNSAASWLNTNWSINPSSACNSAEGDGSFAGASLFYFGVVTPGNTYKIEVTFSLLNAVGSKSGCWVWFGGEEIELVTGAGTYTWIVTAQTASSIGFVMTSRATACVEVANVYDVTPQFVVDVLNDNLYPVASFDYGTDPSYFTFSKDRVIVAIPTSAIGVSGCHTIRFTDECDDTVLTSQCVNFGTFDCSLVLSACNTSDAVGFVNPWRPEMRVVGTVRRPTYQLEYGQERLSNGTWNRPFADRQTRLELAIEPVGEVAHAFLSTLGLYDHFYIGREEYIVTAEAHEPAYSDVYDATAGIIIEIAPKTDLARKIRASEDTGGCQPPPNYLVQGTGPNEDYVTQTDGNLILLQ